MEDLNKKYPPNKKPSELAADKKESRVVKSVIKNGVVSKKKGLGSKVTEAFIGEDVDNVGEYMLFDVVIPAVKDTISNLVSGSVEMLLFGEAKGGGRNRSRRNGRNSTSYDKASYNSSSRRETRRIDRRAAHDFEDIVLETRGDAEEVLGSIADLIQDYGMATVADFYGLVGMSSTFADNKYGWSSVDNARVERVRSGYIVNLPKPRILD